MVFAPTGSTRHQNGARPAISSVFQPRGLRKACSRLATNPNDAEGRLRICAPGGWQHPGLPHEPGNLDLNHEHITDVAELGQRLGADTALQALHLGGNKITDVAELGKGLAANTALQTLDLNENMNTRAAPQRPNTCTESVERHMVRR